MRKLEHIILSVGFLCLTGCAALDLASDDPITQDFLAENQDNTAQNGEGVEDEPIRTSSSAREKLAHLEEALSPEEYQQYTDYLPYLTNTKDRLAFLSQDSIADRDRFAKRRGFYNKVNRFNVEIQSAIRRRDIVVGMQREALTESWGEPSRIEVSGIGSNAERWTYYANPGLKEGKRFVYLEDGVVVGWDSSH